ncbi:MAG: dynamin family protein [Pseudomonadota bacterium]
MTGTDPSPAALDHLAAWHAARPGFALLGEFSAGKSTLLNYLLGEELLPTQVTATELPPIWISHGTAQRHRMLGRDGILTPTGSDLLEAGGAGDALLVHVTHPAPILRRTDIIDTPGISDPRLARNALDFLMPFLDFAIWCSPAGQAWRQTEKAMWTSVPKTLRKHSLLTLTRVDKLRNDRDRERVLTRARSETDGLFSKVLPLDTPAALAATDDATAEASGAAAFQDALDASLTAAEALCAARPDISLPKPAAAPRQTPVVADATDTVPIADDRPDPKPENTPENAMSDADAAIIQSMVEKMSVVRAEAEAAEAAKGRLTARLEEMVAQLEIETSDENLFEVRRIVNDLHALTDLSPEHRLVLDLALAITGPDDVDPARALAQVQADLLDFAPGPWRRLDIAEDPSATAAARPDGPT